MRTITDPYPGLTMLADVDADYVWFVQVLDEVCMVWPEAAGVRNRYGTICLHDELNKHSFSVIFSAHMKRKPRAMVWELCTILMRDRRIKKVGVARELLRSLAYMWEVCGDAHSVW